MLRVARPEFFKRSALAIRTFASTTDGEDSQHSDIRNVSQPALRQKGAKNKDLSDILDGIKPKGQVNALTNQVNNLIILDTNIDLKLILIQNCAFKL